MKAALTAAQKRMAARGVRGNYTKRENLHLTLAFIGEHPRPEAVLEALGSVSFTPFELTLDGIGSFGDVWLAGTNDPAALEAVVRRVRRALAENGIPFDRKRFVPHITLIRRPVGDLPETFLEPASMTVSSISLMRSDRGRSGMIYTQVGAIDASL